MNHYTPAPKWLNIYCSSAIFLFCLLSLIVRSGYSFGAVLLLIGGIYTLFKAKKINLSKEDKFLLIVLAFFTLEGIVNNIWHLSDLRNYDKTIRLLLAIPIFFLIRWSKPKLVNIWLATVIGTFAAGSLAIYEKLYLGVARAGGPNNPIQFGNLSLLMGFFCLAGIGWAFSLPKTPKRNIYILLLFLGATLGILASILSGSRGGWVGIPFVFLVLYKAYGELLNKRTKIIIITALAIAIISVFNLPQTGIKNRVYTAVHDIQSYKSNSHTSVGLRFEAWRGASKLFIEKPIMGWGVDGFKQGMTKAIQENNLDPEIATFGHAHNDFFDKAAKQGIFGILALFLLYLVPIWYFNPYLKHTNLAVRSVAAAGTILPVAYIDFGLTQGFLSHNSGIMLFAIWLMIWAGVLQRKLDLG